MSQSLQKYIDAFEKALGIEKMNIGVSLAYNSVPEWDSLGHMALVSEIEEAFSVQFSTEEVIEFSDFKKGLEILGLKGQTF